ncbi:MAG: hypothetical protein IKS83_05565 [Victivallales bacterium]|nr:hypothetical protein [Victivallales bacterium]
MRIKAFLFSILVCFFCLAANGQAISGPKKLSPKQLDARLSRMDDQQKQVFMEKYLNSVIEAYQSQDEEALEYLLSLKPVIEKHLEGMASSDGENDSQHAKPKKKKRTPKFNAEDEAGPKEKRRGKRNTDGMFDGDTLNGDSKEPTSPQQFEKLLQTLSEEDRQALIAAYWQAMLQSCLEDAQEAIAYFDTLGPVIQKYDSKYQEHLEELLQRILPPFSNPYPSPSNPYPSSYNPYPSPYNPAIVDPEPEPAYTPPPMCHACYGTGICQTCKGVGTTSGYGHTVECGTCAGSGKCRYCNGNGY